jgi:hypothetical protein
VQVSTLAPAEKTKLLQTYRDRHRLAVLIETGLYYGYGSGQHVQGLRSYVAIDAQQRNVEIARENGYRAVHGDSGAILPRVLEAFDEPILFWLDAHSVGDDEGIDVELPPCPILAELAAIVEHRDRLDLAHVVLIDDLRQFADPHGFNGGPPSLDELRDVCRTDGWRIVEGDDIMRLTR